MNPIAGLWTIIPNLLSCLKSFLEWSRECQLLLYILGELRPHTQHTYTNVNSRCLSVEINCLNFTPIITLLKLVVSTKHKSDLLHVDLNVSNVPIGVRDEIPQRVSKWSRNYTRIFLLVRVLSPNGTKSQPTAKLVLTNNRKM